MNPPAPSSFWTFKGLEEPDNLWIVVEADRQVTAYRRAGSLDEEPTKRPTQEFLLLFEPAHPTEGGNPHWALMALIFVGFLLRMATWQDLNNTVPSPTA